MAKWRPANWRLIDNILTKWRLSPKCRSPICRGSIYIYIYIYIHSHRLGTPYFSIIQSREFFFEPGLSWEMLIISRCSISIYIIGLMLFKCYKVTISKNLIPPEIIKPITYITSFILYIETKYQKKRIFFQKLILFWDSPYPKSGFCLS